ncbi:MAG: FG-GAP repeat protein, partial [Bacteroidetes bacterium]|nr:FG-GAP repeat protein [Bacteroidota bacterium]
MSATPMMLRATAFILLLGLLGPATAAAQLLAPQKISATHPGSLDRLHDADDLGRSVASLGDLDGDGVSDLAVGALQDDDGGGANGAVWILFLNENGTVKARQKISSTQGAFSGRLENSGFFVPVARLDDLDGDGVPELAVGAPEDDGGGDSRGAVWILFLKSDGTVKGHQKISDTEGGFTGRLENSDRFGSVVASLGDLDGDGTSELAVGAIRDNDGGLAHGAVWVLF